MLLGHHLLNLIDDPKFGFKLWENLEVRFDEHSSLKTANSYVSWRFVGSDVRPDIALAAKPAFLTGDDRRDLLIELKCLRSIWKSNRNTGHDYVSNEKCQMNALKDDLRKIKDYANLHNALWYRGVMCVFHLHELSVGEGSVFFSGLPWEASQQHKSDRFLVRRYLTLLDGDDNDTQMNKLLAI